MRGYKTAEVRAEKIRMAALWYGKCGMKGNNMGIHREGEMVCVRRSMIRK